MKAGALVQGCDGVALVAVGLLAEAGDDTARLGIDGHLAAVDEVRALAGLCAQL